MNLPKHEVLSVLAKRIEDADTGPKRVFYPEIVAHLKSKGKTFLTGDLGTIAIVNQRYHVASV